MNKVKVKLNIKYKGPITFSKEIFIDYNHTDHSPFLIDYELKTFLFNIKVLNQSITYWNNHNYQITI